MKSVADSSPGEIARLLPAGGRTALFLDYDGTLVPFHDDPSRAVPGEELLKLLGRLAAAPGSDLVIVSGRTAGDLRRLLDGRVPCHHLALHGAQYVSADGRVTDLVDLGPCREQVRAAAEACRRTLSRVPGARLEHKEAALALHTRRCDPTSEKRAVADFLEIAREATSGGALSVLKGSRVIELKPAAADKGSGVLWLMEWLGPSVFPIYVGDDATDEDAFRALRDRGLTIFVGRPGQETLARHRLEDHRAVRTFLEGIAPPLRAVG